MTVCTVNPDDFDTLERLHMDCFKPGMERERWRAQAQLIRFIEEHPTLLPFLIAAGRRERKTA
jgi:hypothetical protein